jgi:hypothetical protein
MNNRVYHGRLLPEYPANSFYVSLFSGIEEFDIQVWIFRVRFTVIS